MRIRDKSAEENDDDEGEAQAYQNGDETHTFVNERVKETDSRAYKKITQVG